MKTLPTRLNVQLTHLTRLATYTVALLLTVTSCANHSNKAENTMNTEPYNKLTPEEKHIILDKGTERPFTGKYTTSTNHGIYICKRCNAPLYTSNDKFISHCGWPSFDDEIPGAIRRQPDADGHRTEILCANCGAHLGHVFAGEHLTEKNLRHCVNSLSLNFIPSNEKPPAKISPPKKAYFAGGCFWGVEYMFEHKAGVISATSGYMGGTLKNPTYQQIFHGNTGHYETVEITYNPDQISYEDLARFFFEIHDPTQPNGQGPDIGEQYQSVIFVKNDKQRKTAEKLIATLKQKNLKIATKILPATTFWPAEEHHQNYYDKKHSKPYCHIYTERF